MTLVAAFAPTLGWELPLWARQAGAVAGVIMILWPALGWLEDKIKAKQAWMKMTGIIGMILSGTVFAGSAVLYFWPHPNETVTASAHAPFLSHGIDYSINGGGLTGRLGGSTADLRATVYTDDTSAIGSGRDVTFTINFLNNDTHPVYLNKVRLLEVYFLKKSAVWNLERFRDFFSTAVKSGASAILNFPQRKVQTYRIDKTPLYYAKYDPSGVTYEGNPANTLVTIIGKSTSQLKAKFSTPKLNPNQFSSVNRGDEFDILNNEGFAIVRLCPLSVTNYPVPASVGGYQGWNPLWKQPFQVVPNSDQSVVCQSVGSDFKGPPVVPPPSQVPQ